MVFDTGGGLRSAGKVVVKGMFARCTAPLLPCARPAAVSAVRQGLSVQLGRSVALQLGALMMVSTDTPASWSAALPPTPAFTAAARNGESRAGETPPLAHCGVTHVATPRPRTTITNLTRVLTFHGPTTMAPRGTHTGPERCAGRRAAPPPPACRPVLCTLT